MAVASAGPNASLHLNGCVCIAFLLLVVGLYFVMP